MYHASGSVFVAGTTGATDLPTPLGFRSPSRGTLGDAFAARLARGGASILYGAYLGGFADDDGVVVATDGAGGVYAGGSTGRRTSP